MVVNAFLVSNIASVIFRILKIQAEIVALLLFCITIMLVPIIQGRKCQV